MDALRVSELEQEEMEESAQNTSMRALSVFPDGKNPLEISAIIISFKDTEFLKHRFAGCWPSSQRIYKDPQEGSMHFFRLKSCRLRSG
jgi:hypothetical protein